MRRKALKPSRSASVICMLLTLMAMTARPVAALDAPARASAVKGMRPVAYWPMDEGKGTVIHDASGNGHDGAAYHLPWNDGLLQFTSETYQWVQLPCADESLKGAFSIGGWVFTHHAKYRARGFLFMGKLLRPAGKDGATGKIVYRWGGVGNALQLPEPFGMQIHVGGTRKGEKSTKIGVISAGVLDVVGSTAKDIVLAAGQWQHVLYTYDAGVGKLYLDGQLVASASDVPFDSKRGKAAYMPAKGNRVAIRRNPDGEAYGNSPWVVGGDMVAWGVWPWGIQSLSGSVRDIVQFDRALTPDEVRRLREATQPDKPPVAKKKTRLASPMASKTVPELTAILRDAKRPDAERAEAALALGNKGASAIEAVPALIQTLQEQDKRRGAHLPRVEEWLRNAAMHALLDIAPKDEAARKALGQSLAKPALNALDLSQDYLKEVKQLAEAGRPMDAIEAVIAHRKTLPRLPGHVNWGFAEPDDIRKHLPLRPEYRDNLLTKGNPFSDGLYAGKGFRPADYTCVDMVGDTVYMTVVERVPMPEVEKQFGATLKGLTKERPDPKAKWSRVRILKINADGTEESALVAGPWFLFNTQDAKMDGWAVGIDSKGYVHLVGGQHNSPRPENYIPGSWEKLGLDKSRKGRPRAMYWVSRKPGDIASMVFMGKPDNPRSIPCDNLNYMNFARSPGGVLFLYGRGYQWTWGMYRYDAKTQRWKSFSGMPLEMLERAKKTAPEWSRLTEPAMPTYGPSPKPAFVYAWQLCAYNFCRSRWGVRFDPTGRLHFQVPIRGVGQDAKITDGPLYAYSDDLGETFHGVDGKELQLPLTVCPVPNHCADISVAPRKRWFDLWLSLMKRVAYPMP